MDPYTTRTALAVIVMHSHRNTRFGPVVGEPRGLGTHLVYGSQAGYIQYLRFNGFYTAV